MYTCIHMCVCVSVLKPWQEYPDNQEGLTPSEASEIDPALPPVEAQQDTQPKDPLSAHAGSPEGSQPSQPAVELSPAAGSAKSISNSKALANAIFHGPPESADGAVPKTAGADSADGAVPKPVSADSGDGAAPKAVVADSASAALEETAVADSARLEPGNASTMPEPEKQAPEPKAPEAAPADPTAPSGPPDRTLELAGLEALLKNQEVRLQIQNQQQLANAQQVRLQHGTVLNTPHVEINWSSHRKEGMRLKRLMEESSGGAKFPHMQKMWSGSAAVPGCTFLVPFLIFLFWSAFWFWISLECFF